MADCFATEDPYSLSNFYYYYDHALVWIALHFCAFLHAVIMCDNVLPFTKPSKQSSLKAYGACHPKINASTVCVGKMTERLNCEVTMTPTWSTGGGRCFDTGLL